MGHFFSIQFLFVDLKQKRIIIMGGTISDIVKVVDDAVKQIILQIDPSIHKVRNTTLIILDNIETKVHSNTFQLYSSLRRNLLVWLFLALIFAILVLTLIRYLIDILHKLQFSLLTRQYSTLFVLTIISFWIFFSSVFGVFLREDLDWVTLKILVFSFLCCCVLLLTFIWLRFTSIYQRRIVKKLKKFFCQWNSIKEKGNRLQQSTMTLHMLAIKQKSIQQDLMNI